MSLQFYIANLWPDMRTTALLVVHVVQIFFKDAVGSFFQF